MDGPHREDAIRIARERMLEDGLLRASVPDSLVAAEIEQSWRRSISHRVDPGAEPLVLGEIDPDTAVLRAAGRVLDQWHENLTQSRLALLLADEHGRILSRRIVDAQDERILDRANAIEGFDFSERALGTNGLGTPIEARDVVFVRGTEHFNEKLARLACAGAPIKHPVTGRIVGSLSFASHVDVSSPLMVAMVRQAGQQIAEALENMADSRDLELARVYRRFRVGRRSVLVMSSDTVMTDLPSLAHLDAEAHAVLWEKLRAHAWTDDVLRLELPSLGTEALVRRLGRGDHDAIFALEFLGPDTGPSVAAPSVAPGAEGGAPVVGGGSDALVATRRPVESPYARVRRQLTAVADPDGFAHLVGGPGVGKRFQAVLWLRERTGQDPAIFTRPDLSEGSSFWTDVAEVVRQGRGVVVETDEAEHADRIRLADLARNERPAPDGGAAVVLTERRTAADEAAPDAVRVPALVELRDELPTVIREVAAVRLPDLPAPRFSPAALRCLLSWQWPGNVAELVRLLAFLPQTPEGGFIRTKDLPPSLRRSPEVTMSRYEQAERDALIEALREAEGNKSRAAEILGIGRTTLYRKMRTLKIDEEQLGLTGP